jgi:F-box domain.
MEELPEEIVLHIFSFTNLETWINLKLVSKFFNRICCEKSLRDAKFNEYLETLHPCLRFVYTNREKYNAFIEKQVDEVNVIFGNLHSLKDKRKLKELFNNLELAFLFSYYRSMSEDVRLISLEKFEYNEILRTLTNYAYDFSNTHASWIPPLDPHLEQITGELSEFIRQRFLLRSEERLETCKTKKSLIKALVANGRFTLRVIKKLDVGILDLFVIESLEKHTKEVASWFQVNSKKEIAKAQNKIFKRIRSLFRSFPNKFIITNESIDFLLG